jgi:hypothetical protein
MKALGALSESDVVNLVVVMSEYSRGGVARDRGVPLGCSGKLKAGRVRVVGRGIPLWVPKCLQVWVIVVSKARCMVMPVGRRVLARY